MEEQDGGEGGTERQLRKLGLGRQRGFVVGEVKGEEEERKNTLSLFFLLFDLLSASSMRVRLLLFARAKELVGTGETELELADGALRIG